jgi:hypothetical protein
MSNDNVPHPPGRLISLRNVVLRIEQEAKLAGSPHSAIELVLRALRCGEIHAVGVYAGDQTSRSIGPADWEGLIIEIAPQRIFEVNGPPTLVVRRLGAPGGSPEVTHVRLDALDVTAWRDPAETGRVHAKAAWRNTSSCSYRNPVRPRSRPGYGLSCGRSMPWRRKAI